MRGKAACNCQGLGALPGVELCFPSLRVADFIGSSQARWFAQRFFPLTPPSPLGRGRIARRVFANPERLDSLQRGMRCSLSLRVPDGCTVETNSPHPGPLTFRWARVDHRSSLGRDGALRRPRRAERHHVHTSRSIHSARADAGGDIAARCPYLAGESGQPLFDRWGRRLAQSGVIGVSRAIRSARADAGGDIAARCPYLAGASVSIARRQRAMASFLKLRLRQRTTHAVFSNLRAIIVAGTKSAA